jgi:hypothetical protein
MARKRSLLLVQVLLFLLVTLLGVATGNLTNSTGVLPGGLEFLRRQSLSLAGITVLLIIGVMVWQYRAEQRLVLPARPVWDSERSPFPGLEAFTEQDSAVFFGRDAEITELLDRLHPVVTTHANRLVAVVGPSGAGKSSLVQPVWWPGCGGAGATGSSCHRLYPGIIRCAAWPEASRRRARETPPTRGRVRALQTSFAPLSAARMPQCW